MLQCLGLQVFHFICGFFLKISVETLLQGNPSKIVSHFLPNKCDNTNVLSLKEIPRDQNKPQTNIKIMIKIFSHNALCINILFNVNSK